MKVIIGIDNGTTTGGMVAISAHDGAIIGTRVMPWVKRKSRKEIDLNNAWSWMIHVTGNDLQSALYVIEEPNNSRNASTAYSVASCFHSFRGFFIAKNLTFKRITPQSWQKEMLGRVPKGLTKGYALVTAMDLWPHENFHASPRCKTPHEGIVDAALIAEYLRRNNEP